MEKKVARIGGHLACLIHSDQVMTTSQTWLDGLTTHLTPPWVAHDSFFFFCSLSIEHAVSISPRNQHNFKIKQTNHMNRMDRCKTSSRISGPEIFPSTNLSSNPCFNRSIEFVHILQAGNMESWDISGKWRRIQAGNKLLSQTYTYD